MRRNLLSAVILFLGAAQSSALQAAEFEDPGAMCHVAFSPDGKLLATCSGINDPNGMVTLWDLRSGMPLWQVKESSGFRSVAFSPDGKELAAGNFNKTILLLEVSSGKTRIILKGHTDKINSVAFSPDGKILASSGMDHTIKLWDMAGGKEKNTLKGHDEWVLSVAFSPDGRYLASAGGTPLQPVDRAGTARIWDVATGKMLHVLKGHQLAVEGVAFPPGGTFVATSSWDNTIKFWDLKSGKELKSLEGHAKPVYTLDFHPQGHLLASGAAVWGGPVEAIRLWDPGSGKALPGLGEISNVLHLCFSPDGQMLAAACAPVHQVQLWEVQSRQLRGILSLHTRISEPEKRDMADQLKDLESGDAGRAYRAIWRLVEIGDKVVPDLARSVVKPPRKEPNPKMVEQLIQKLTDDNFQVREQATQDLARLGPSVAPVLKKAREKSSEIEEQNRLDMLLRQLEGSRDLRTQRALEVLERIGSPEAQKVLRQAAQDWGESDPGWHARSALGRLERKVLKNTP